MNRSGSRLTIIFATAVAVAVTVPAAHAAYPGANGKLAFEHTDFPGAPPEIAVMDPDGSNRTSLGGTFERAPVWSPDGTRIAYEGYVPGGDTDLYVMDADGSDRTRLTDSPGFDGTPTWSPDGTRMAFTSRRDGNDEIYVMDADGTDQTRLTTDPELDYDPAWSPDGGKIAFVSVVGTQAGDVWVMDPDGTDPEQLTSDPAFDFEPAWSPDGSRIVFTTNRDSRSGEGQVFGQDLYVMSADGTGETPLVLMEGGNANQAAWSPDGRRIAFHTNETGRDLIGIVDADGSNRTTIGLWDGTGAFSPDWQPVPEEQEECDSAPEPVGCWRFDEPGGATAVDSGPFGNDGAYVNGPVLGVPGVAGTAVSMDGRDDHVVVPDSTSLDVGDSFTLEGWIARDTDRTVEQLFNKGAKGFQLVVMSRFDGDQVWLRKAGSATIVRSQGGVPADGAFHHVVATKDGPGSARIHIDGVEQAVQVASGAQVVQDTAARLFFSATASGDVVDGDLDAFAVYDRALTAAEVARRFERRRPAAATAAPATAARTAGVDDSGCGRAGTATSGIVDLQARGVPCVVATRLAFAGLAALRAAGFTCTVRSESFGRPVRIGRRCTGPPGVTVTYTTLG